MIWQIDKLENSMYNINWLGYLAYFLVLNILWLTSDTYQYSIKDHFEISRFWK